MGVFVVLHSDVEKEHCVTFDILEPLSRKKFNSQRAPHVKTFRADIYMSQIKYLNAKLNQSENMGLLADQYLFIHDELQRFEVEPRFFKMQCFKKKIHITFSNYLGQSIVQRVKSLNVKSLSQNRETRNFYSGPLDRRYFFSY